MNKETTLRGKIEEIKSDYLFDSNFRYEQIQAMKSSGQIHIKFVEEEKEILKHTDKFINQILNLISKEIKKNRPKEKHHYSEDWHCPKCSAYGNEGEYCPNDRRKLLKSTTEWESDEDSSFNNGLNLYDKAIADTLGEEK